MPYPSPFVESEKPGIIECKKAPQPKLHSALVETWEGPLAGTSRTFRGADGHLPHQRHRPPPLQEHPALPGKGSAPAKPTSPYTWLPLAENSTGQAQGFTYSHSRENVSCSSESQKTWFKKKWHRTSNTKRPHVSSL